MASRGSSIGRPRVGLLCWCSFVAAAVAACLIAASCWWVLKYDDVRRQMEFGHAGVLYRDGGGAAYPGKWTIEKAKAPWVILMPNTGDAFGTARLAMEIPLAPLPLVIALPGVVILLRRWIAKPVHAAPSHL
ncbi:MAG: hypothetical protein ACREJO_16835 [Phycisphaerales bacterium]